MTSFENKTRSPHTFHIPVMGTGFSIDTPLRVAKYGISSVIQLGDQVLIEQMRRYHSELAGEPYEEIPERAPEARALRTTAYLNLIDRLVKRQVAELQASPFEPGSEITRYYEMLPETSLKRTYRKMLSTKDPVEKKKLQEELRHQAVPGSIDVNIMTKVDQDLYRDGQMLPPAERIATASLKGYAESELCSSIIFSAGMNPRLYGLIPQYADFLPDENGHLKKKVVLKVSDYRSAEIQGKFLAKRGVWVSEYRIESGLNCGGHAFATQGYLLGPILEELKQKKQELVEQLHSMYLKGLASLGRSFAGEVPPEVLITVQGGIGTAHENEFLMKYYRVDGTGWGTPFLLVPEVTNVDEEHLQKLAQAPDKDVHLSENSPLGVPFWSLKTAASEILRDKRIAEGASGAPCPKGYLAFNTDFTETPVCAASRVFQKKKLEHLVEEDLSEEQRACVEKSIMAKTCLCMDLAGGVLRKYKINLQAAPSICCGPNIVNFSKIASLEEMVDHIYGRISLITNTNRPHMFIKELMIYIEYLRKELEKFSLNLSPHAPKYFIEFKENLLSGIEYYTVLAEHFIEEKKDVFLEELESMRDQIEALYLEKKAVLCAEVES